MRRTQQRMEGFNKVVFAGCHLTRRIADLVGDAGLQVKEAEEFYEPSAPRFVGAYTLGVAVA